MTQPLPPTDQQLADYIGPHWEARYRRKFERFRSDPRGRFRPSWNWFAALFPAWFFAHRLYAAFSVLFLCMLTPAGLGFTEIPQGGLAIFRFAFAYIVFVPAALAWLAYNVVYSPGIGSVALLMVAVALMVAQGVIADWLLYRKALAAAATTPTPVVTTGRTRRRRPPSLVSPVAAVAGMVVVAFFFLGSFVSVACGCPEKSYTTFMKDDLRTLLTTEESFFTAHGSYTSSTTALRFESSTGGSVSITSANGTGWAATASRKDTDKTCGIFVGSATAPIAGQQEGEPRCVASVDSVAHPPSHR
jgi:hypothetical protein